MAVDPNENRVPDEPRISEQDWYTLAITSSCFSLVFFCFAFVWVFNCGDAGAIKDRAQAITPFGAACFAIVTFCTVAWRGIQTDRQLRYQDKQLSYQGDQLRQIARQNDAKEEENHVKVMQEGAKLIAEKEKASQVLAGISSLDYLLEKRAHPFAGQAANLLANLLMESYGPSDLDIVNRAAIDALKKCENIGIFPSIDGKFARPIAKENNYRYWHYIPAIQKLSLTGGALSFSSYKRMHSRIKMLKHVRLEGINIDFADEHFHECLFVECRVTNVSNFDIYEHSFLMCDFSGAVLDTIPNSLNIDGGTKLKGGRNYFRKNAPPVNRQGQSLAHWFLSEEELQPGTIRPKKT